MKIKEKILYKGKILDLKKVEIKLDKKKIEHEIACFHLPKSVGILPLIDKNKAILIKHYRFAAKKEMWEIPAGFLEKNEKPEDGAKRELKEEIGFEAKRLKRMVECYFSPGYLREYMILFKATSLKKEGSALDQDEIINKIKIFTKNECLKMIKNKKIVDSKTILTILLWKLEELKK